MSTESENGVGDLPLYDTVEGFAEDVINFLERREDLVNIFRHLHERHVNGEKVQPAFEKLFSDNQFLVGLIVLNEAVDLGKSLDNLVENGYISQDDKEILLGFLNETSWAADCATAFTNNYVDGVNYWTDKSLDVTYEGDGSIVVGHRLVWGVDEVHALRIPLSDFLTDSISRVSVTVDGLDEEKIEGDTLEMLESTADELEAVAEDFRERTNDLRGETNEE